MHNLSGKQAAEREYIYIIIVENRLQKGSYLHNLMWKTDCQKGVYFYCRNLFRCTVYCIFVPGSELSVRRKLGFWQAAGNC